LWQIIRMVLDEFPRQLARTRRFSLGVPRAVTISVDGGRVLFLRTSGGEDPVSRLWLLDLTDDHGHDHGHGHGHDHGHGYDSGGASEGGEQLRADPTAPTRPPAARSRWSR
jgi:dipeptidyl-peptidase 4